MTRLPMDKAEFVNLTNECLQRQGLPAMTEAEADADWNAWVEEMQQVEKYINHSGTVEEVLAPLC